MTWNYYPLKFPDKATADGLLVMTSTDGSNYFKYPNTDVIGIDYDINGIPKSGWLVNLAVETNLPTALLTYLIPFPLFPKRVYFTNQYGGMM